MKWFKIVFFVFIALIFSYFIIGEFFLVADTPSSGADCEQLSCSWTLIDSDGKQTAFDFPGSIDLKENEIVTLRATLPEIKFGTSCVCFQSARQDMKVSVGGEERLYYSTENTRVFGKMNAIVYLFVPINDYDSGKTIDVELKSSGEASVLFSKAYIGTRLGIWMRFINQYGAEIVVALITLVLSVLAIVSSIVMSKVYKKPVELQYLGWGVFFAAVWVIVNSIFRQLVFPNISVISDIAFLMVMILLFPFVIYVNEIQKRRYSKIYIIAQILLVVNFILCVVLHITQVRDFSYTIRYSAITAGLCILIIIATIIADAVKKYLHEYRLIAIGIFSSFVCAIFQFLVYFINPTDFSGAILSVGLSALLVFSIINAVREIVDMENDKQSALLANKAKNKFLANMSHEIRTPITAVLGFNTMILRESHEPQILEYSSNIESAGQSLLSIINDILDFSKIEAGKMTVVPQKYNLGTLIKDVVNMVSVKASAKGITVKMDVDGSLPSVLYGDDVRIRQILVNIMNNAVKYTEHGGVTLYVGGESDGDDITLKFKVVDTGIGIKQEDMKKLYEEFERIDETHNRNIEGTGLGLSITVNLLALMNSKLNVESEYKHGTTVSFNLEQKIVDNTKLGTMGAYSDANASKKGRNSNIIAPDAEILVVDDNKINRKVFIGLLKSLQSKIDEADGGKAALEKISSKKYDIIFLDHMMPEIDGVEVLRTMRSWEDYPNMNTPVVALTANAVTGAREEYLEIGFNEYLPKPIEPSKLEHVIYKHIAVDKLKANTTQYEELYSSKSSKMITDLPQIDGIDWEYAKIKLGSVDMILDIAKEFSKNAEKRLEELNEAYNDLVNTSNEDIAEYAVKKIRGYAHSMKSTPAMMGAYGVSEMAKMLEYAARDGNQERVVCLTSIFADEWIKLKEDIDRVLLKTE